jgi:DNA-binding NarL/FixJ family response regulator
LTGLGAIASGVLLRGEVLALVFAVDSCLGQLSGSSETGLGASPSPEREAGRERESKGGEKEKAKPPARLLLVDDHPFMRVAMRATLDGEPDLMVVGEAKDGQEAVERCREHEPDLILMDVSMPGMDGIEATRKIKEEFPKTSVLVLTAHAEQSVLMEAVKAGAAGYVLKEDHPDRILGSVRAVLDGDTPLDQGLAMQLLRSIGEEASSAQSAASPTAWTTTTEKRPASASLSNPLTPREREVLGLLASGRANRQIAKELHLSLSTVKRHLEHIMSKLEVSDRTQAVVKAIEMDLLFSYGTREEGKEGP